MTIIKEMKLRYFEFWSEAQVNAGKLSYEQLDEIEEILEDVYPDGISETELNDLFWLDFDTICEWLGIDPDDE